MAVMRVHKTKDYTVMSNVHFREREMSLKAKGLLSLMFSLPDTWDYSIAGLVAICKENETAIKSTLNELKKFGYLSVTKLMPNQTESGRIEYVYDIFEKPTDKENLPIEKQGTEKQGVENLGVENQGQLSTKKSSTKKSSTNKLNTNKGNNYNNEPAPQKKKKGNSFEEKTIRENTDPYGKYSNVFLKTEEYVNLVNDYNGRVVDTAIDILGDYIANKNPEYIYTDHNRALESWVLLKAREVVIKQKEIEQREQRAKEIDAKQKAAAENDSKYIFNGKRISELSQVEYDAYIRSRSGQPNQREFAPFDWLNAGTDIDKVDL